MHPLYITYVHVYDARICKYLYKVCEHIVTCELMEPVNLKITKGLLVGDTESNIKL